MKSMKKIILIFNLFIFSFSNNINAQWVNVSNGLGSENVLSLASNGNNIIAGTNFSGVYVSTNNGESWIQTSLDSGLVQAVAIDGNTYFAGTRITPGPPYGSLYISTNNGLSWTQNALNNYTINAIWANGNIIYVGTSANTPTGFFKSINYGVSWANHINFPVYSLAVNGNTVYAGTGPLYISTNNGASWTTTNLNNHVIHGLGLNGNTVFAGTAGAGTYRSTNNGANFTLTTLNVNVWANFAVSGDNIFAASKALDPYNGVYVSNNNGLNWTKRNEGLDVDLLISSISISGNYIFIGSRRGVHRRPLGELIGIKTISSEIPSSFSLSQNYPNPFNPATKIIFDLKNSGLVKFVVFDMFGKEVKTLVNEKLSAGSYLTEFDGSGLTSGVYFYKIEIGDYSEVKKMILLK